MGKKSCLLMYWILILFGFSACQTNHNTERRNYASLETYNNLDSKFDEAFIETFEESIKNNDLFQPVVAVSPNSNSLADILLNSGIKEALIAEFTLADEYQENSDHTYAECLKARALDPTANCQSIMDTEIYKKSLAIWMLSDFAREKARLAYRRLLSLSEEKLNSELVIKIADSTNSDAEKIKEFASDFRASFVKGLKNNVINGFAYVQNHNGHTEYRRGAMGTLDYAASAELAQIINEENPADSDFIDVSLESLFKINQNSYKKEATTGKVQNEELEAFINIIEQMESDKKQRQTASIGWHDVWGKTFKRGEFALTYDDGPKKSTSTKLLNYLGSDTVKRQLGYTPHATFFWQAQSARRGSNSSVLKQAKSLGYGLASHSYSHQDFARFIRGGRLSWNTTNKKGEKISLKRQLSDAKDILENVYGTQLNYFRLPYASGRNSRLLQQQIGNNNLVHIFWNINADDWRWRSVSKSSITRNYIREIDKAGRGVILLHDIHENTVGPLTQALISHFAKNKDRYKIVPLEKGIQETFINIAANGPLPRTINRIASTRVANSHQNKPVQLSDFPQFRRITVGKLNVRSGASSRYPICGSLKSGDQVKVVGQNSWFEIDTLESRVLSSNGSRKHNCGPRAFISNGSSYSSR